MQQKRWHNQRLNRFGVITLIIVLPFLSGCWMAVAAGAGAYGGYKMKEKRLHRSKPDHQEEKCGKSIGLAVQTTDSLFRFFFRFGAWIRIFILFTAEAFNNE